MLSNMLQRQSKINEILQHISDISTGRASLNINQKTLYPRRVPVIYKLNSYAEEKSLSHASALQLACNCQNVFKIITLDDMGKDLLNLVSGS